ncbi:MAG TPA: ribose-phosphate pyrophosphokinase [Gammaproteobacteria bacterium]|nr:ribose-phosphate pyrophosphokinase [Gammaproteobacteria bacterium]
MRPETPVDLMLFALEAERELGERMAAALGIGLGRHEEREFEDGEHKARPLENVRGRDVYVVCSLFADTRYSVNDKLVRLLFFLGALKDAAAQRVTAVVPYLCYARKDRKSKSRDPVSTRYVARLFEAMGADRMVTMDVHNLAAYQNAFRIPTEHLEARKLFVDRFAGLVGDAEVAVVSPDVGGIKRADAFREGLQARVGRAVGAAVMEKRRSAGVVSGDMLAGDVRGRSVIIVDDIISSGTTLGRTAHACRDAGAVRVYGAASHGLFVGQAEQVVTDAALAKLVVTGTVPPFRLQSPDALGRLEVIDVAPLLAEAVYRMHSGGSIVDMLAV